MPGPVRRDGKLEYTSHLRNNAERDGFLTNTEVRAVPSLWTSYIACWSGK